MGSSSDMSNLGPIVVDSHGRHISRAHGRKVARTIHLAAKVDPQTIGTRHLDDLAS